MDDDITSHVKTVRDRYERHLREHDENAATAAHWKTQERLDLRYEVLSEIDDLDGSRILDFGCGTGLLADFLDSRGVDCEYVGWDISDEMVEIARERHPEASFRQIDVLNENTAHFEGAFDYVFVCGVFHIKDEGTRSAHEAWMYQTLRELWPLCEEGLAVNFMTEHVDWRDDELYYCSIDELVKFVADDLSRWFTIRRDYELYEHTAYVYHMPKLSL